MAKWVTEKLEELLVKINEVPYTDDREKQQLSILMNGFMQMNNTALNNAASRTRSQVRDWNLGEPEGNQQTQADKVDDSSADELTRLRPIG